MQPSKKTKIPARKPRTTRTLGPVEEAEQYAKDVVAGKILACKWVQLACQRHCDDKKRKDWPYIFYRPLAERAIRFMELLPHTKGQWAARHELLVLEPWQKFILASLFGWVHRKTKLRRFREAYCEIPRKNGKSQIAAAIGMKLFADDNEHGAEVFSGATSEKQAWEIFRPARLMAKGTPELCAEYGITVNATTLVIMENGSRFQPLIGSPGDGASPSCALIDEYHEHITDVMYETMITGMGAREQPLTLIVTTAGSTLAGPCYGKRAEICKVLEGTVSSDRVFGVIWTIDDDVDWTSEEALRMANPNYGVSVGAEYLRERQQQAMMSARLQNSFKTKHLNVWVGAAASWMNMVEWRQQPARAALADLAGRPCFLGVDLAAKVDLAALIAVFPPLGEDPLWHVYGRYYLPEDTVLDNRSPNVGQYDQWSKEGILTLTSGSVIDYEVIKDDVREFVERFDVRSVGYDPAYAWEFAPSLLTEGLPMVEIRATVMNFSEPMKQIEALVRNKLLAHGNCPALTWMMSNVTAAMDRKDNIYPRKEQPDQKIDGAVALIMAMNRALLQEDTTSIYDQGARL